MDYYRPPRVFGIASRIRWERPDLFADESSFVVDVTCHLSDDLTIVWRVVTSSFAEDYMRRMVASLMATRERDFWRSIAGQAAP